MSTCACAKWYAAVSKGNLRPYAPNLPSLVWHRKHRTILSLCPVLQSTVVHNIAVTTALSCGGSRFGSRTLKQSVRRLSLLPSRHRSHCHLCDSRQGISIRRLRVSPQDPHSSAPSERIMSPGCAHEYHPTTPASDVCQCRRIPHACAVWALNVGALPM